LFFRYHEINDHPCCQMQEVVESFFNGAIAEGDFSINLFPDWFHETLNKVSCTLDLKFEGVFDLLHEQAVTVAFRQALYDQLVITNHIAEVCSGEEVLPASILDLSTPLGAAIKSLMGDLYGSLDLEVFRRSDDGGKARHEFYKEFVKINKYVCPFCGLQKLKNRMGSRREDLDHYLHKSKYPLAAANMRNLIPTCGTCNQDYKGIKDILVDGKAFYPYSDIPPIEIIVDCTVYPATDDLDDSGDWSVNVLLLEPDAEIEPMMSAWERVYSITQRLEDEVSEFFEEWMRDLSEHVSDENNLDEAKFRQLLIDARDEASAAIPRRMKPGEILRAAFFDFMISRAQDSFLESFRWQLNGQRVA